MRRLMVVTVVVLLTASLQVAAQRGGGGHGGGGGGGHAGFSGGGGFGGHSFSGHSFSGHSFSGHSFSVYRGGRVRSGGLASRSMGRGSSFRSRGLYSRNGNRSGVGLRLRTYGYGRYGYGRYGFGNSCYTYGCGWGYGYPYLGGGVDPYWWDSDSDSQNDPDYYDQLGLANEMNQQSLDEQAMRQQQQADQNTYARSVPPAQHQRERTEAAPATVIIFRDQHQEQIQNYAIIGQTLWNFAPQHTQKIPLSDVDIPATTKANEDRGVDFNVPASNEGQ
jgi:hypothetical protein